jgi:hypothetical protein
MCKTRGQDRAEVYVSDVPTDDWSVGVDVQETHAQRRQRVTSHRNTAMSSSDSSKEGAKDVECHMMRKVARKRPASEGPS